MLGVGGLPHHCVRDQVLGTHNPTRGRVRGPLGTRER